MFWLRKGEQLEFEFEFIFNTSAKFFTWPLSRFTGKVIFVIVIVILANPNCDSKLFMWFTHSSTMTLYCFQIGCLSRIPTWKNSSIYIFNLKYNFTFQVQNIWKDLGYVENFSEFFSDWPLADLGVPRACVKTKHFLISENFLGNLAKSLALPRRFPDPPV